MSKTTIVIEHEGPIDLRNGDDRSQKKVLAAYLRKLCTGGASAKVTVTCDGLDIAKAEPHVEQAVADKKAAKAAAPAPKATVAQKVKKAVSKKK